MNFECQFCKSVFKNKGVLTTHQKTAKYCLQLREEKPKKLKDEASKEDKLENTINEYEAKLKSQKESYELQLINLNIGLKKLDKKINILKEEIDRINYQEWDKNCNEYTTYFPKELW